MCERKIITASEPKLEIQFEEAVCSPEFAEGCKEPING